MTKFYLLLSVAALSVSGCNSSDDEYGSSASEFYDSEYAAEAEEAEEEREAFDEDLAREVAEDEIASEKLRGLGVAVRMH